MPNSTSGKARVRFAVALVGVLVFSVALVGLSLRPSRAQSTACVVVFKEMTSGRVDSGATLCQTASGKKCTFQVGLDLNSTLTGCTPVDLKRKKVHAKGSCRRAARVKARGNGPNSVSGTFVGINVKTKKNGNAGMCTLKAKAKTGSSRIALACEPSSSPCATTSTTTTTVVTTTTTTMPSCPANSLSFTSAVGTTNCGSSALTTPPDPPFNGELDSDTGGTMKITDLGLSCLYVGGGNGQAPPGRVPDGATNCLDIQGTNLVASAGTGPTTCTKGAGPGMHCINDNAMGPCSADADCGGATNACQPDANCFFGPPLEFPNTVLEAITTCVLNAIQMDASGTGDPAMGSSTVSFALSSRVYITGNITSPCPHCVSGACTYGAHAGAPCATTTSSQTSLDCPPELGSGRFQGSLPVTLSPLTTGPSSMTAADGIFCQRQINPGALGQAGARRIAVSGTPAGDITDGMPHPSTLGAIFCIPPTGNPAVDGFADLPGPGATSITGIAQVH